MHLTQRTLDATAAFIAISAPDFTVSLRPGHVGLDPAHDPDFILAVLDLAQYGILNDSGYCNNAYDAHMHAFDCALASLHVSCLLPRWTASRA